MKRDGWPGRLAFICFAAQLAVIWCLRVTWIAFDPFLEYVAEGALCFLLAYGMKNGQLSAALLFSVFAPLFAWLIDVSDGMMAIAGGAACLVMAAVYAKCEGAHPALRAALGAVSGAVVIAVGTAITLWIGREMTFPVAVGYAFSRQAWHALAYFGGGLIAFLWMAYRRKHANRKSTEV